MMSVDRGRPEVVGAQVETTHLDRRYLRSYPVSRSSMVQKEKVVSQFEIWRLRVCPFRQTAMDALSRKWIAIPPNCEEPLVTPRAGVISGLNFARHAACSALSGNPEDICSDRVLLRQVRSTFGFETSGRAIRKLDGCRLGW